MCCKCPVLDEGRRHIWQIPPTERLSLRQPLVLLRYTMNGFLASYSNRFIARLSEAIPTGFLGISSTPLKLAAHSSAAHSKMNKINIPQAAAVVCAPLWIYPDTRYATRAVLNAGPSEDVSVHMYMHMLIAIPTNECYSITRYGVLCWHILARL